MTSLANRVEIIKLAHALDVPDTDLAILAPVPADDIRTVRQSLGEAIFAQHEPRFRRIAKLASMVPPQLSARIAQMALSPLLGARVAAVMDPALAVKLAGSLKTTYLADLSTALDPVRAEPILSRIEADLIVEVGRLLVERKEYVALGRFVSVIEPDTALKVIASATGRDLLQVALFAEDPIALDELVRRIDDQRLVDAIRAADEDGLYDDAVTLIASVSPTSRARLVPLITALDQAGLDAFATSLHSYDAWPAALPALAGLDDAALAALANCSATLTPGMLPRMVEVAHELELGALVDRLATLLDADHRKAAGKALTSS
ncbi:hypothetical protein [Nocardioides sp. Root140]|uniref:hypothetical protein n=1 Tax=Nocardioides sp. Root140 TaxID=1736460 RepID=UPI0006F59569|nr:hypothetical protein [Nocardioides sp. Root140]KQY64102.1 hypothetical protein ASD30_03825 [Nocardioides sp. Root140]